MSNKYTYIYQSPVGSIEITGTNDGLMSLHFHDGNKETEGKVPEPLKNAVEQLDQYFGGERKEFSLQLLISGTAFQKKVWKALQNIPYGQTASYKDIAEAIGNKKAMRAVGNANGKNHFPVVIPCHRVIAANKSLGGYSAGLWRKEYLLALEQKFR